MISRRSGLHLCLVLLFLLVQGLVLVHGVEHGFEAEHEDPACHLCIAGHGLGTFISGPTHSFLLLHVAQLDPAPVFVSAPALLPVRPRQRGPPLLS